MFSAYCYWRWALRHTNSAESFNQGINPKDILWIADRFKGGAFESQLSDVDGNAAISKYKDTFKKMFAILRKHNIKINEDDFALFKPDYTTMFEAVRKQGIALNESEKDIKLKYPNIENYCCPLSMVTPVLQRISDELRNLVPNVPGQVTAIDSPKTCEAPIKVAISDQKESFQTHSVIIAPGAIPKSLKDLEGF